MKTHFKDFLWLFLTGLAIGLLWGLSGCYGAKKASEQVAKAIVYYPEQTADKLRSVFPCLTSKDTVTTYKDTLVYVECPDSYYDIYHDTITSVLHDTLHKVIRVPVVLPVQTRYINTTTIDSAQVFVLSAQVANEKKVSEKWRGKAESRGRWELWLLLLLLISLIFNVLQFKFKK